MHLVNISGNTVPDGVCLSRSILSWGDRGLALCGLNEAVPLDTDKMNVYVDGVLRDEKFYRNVSQGSFWIQIGMLHIFNFHRLSLKQITISADTYFFCNVNNALIYCDLFLIGLSQTNQQGQEKRTTTCAGRLPPYSTCQASSIWPSALLIPQESPSGNHSSQMVTKCYG